MRIAIDLDGTACATFERHTEELRSLGHDLSFDDFSYRGGWPRFPDAQHWEWYFANVERLRSSYDPYPGFLFVLAVLSDHEIVFLTHREAVDGRCPGTEEWMRRHGIPYEVIFSQEKARVCRERGIDVIIEDHPFNSVSLVEAGVEVLLKDQPYNAFTEHPDIVRFSHWVEVPRLLRSLEQD